MKEQEKKCCEKCRSYDAYVNAYDCETDECPCHSPQEKKEGWEEEYREYFDKTLKPKKPTMNGLDREITIDFIKRIISSTLSSDRERIRKGVEEVHFKYANAPETETPTWDYVLGEILSFINPKED
jgi:hypothetical protein